jgi:hypothetical protein
MTKTKIIKKDLEEAIYDSGGFGDWFFDEKKGQGFVESFSFQKQLKLKNFSSTIKSYLSGRRRMNNLVFQWVYCES